MSRPGTPRSQGHEGRHGNTAEIDCRLSGGPGAGVSPELTREAVEIAKRFVPWTAEVLGEAANT